MCSGGDLNEYQTVAADDCGCHAGRRASGLPASSQLMRVPLGSDDLTRLDMSLSMMYHHTRRSDMGRSKVAITIDEELLEKLDRLVKRAMFRNRSQAIQIAVKEKLERVDRSRLARECSKLDPGFEKALAEEGLSEELREWPEY